MKNLSSRFFEIGVMQSNLMVHITGYIYGVSIFAFCARIMSYSFLVQAVGILGSFLYKPSRKRRSSGVRRVEQYHSINIALLA